jgi:dynein heavy chain
MLINPFYYTYHINPFSHNPFSTMPCQSYLACVKNSLNMLKKRTCYRVGLIKLEPFFEVDVQLSVPSVRLSPSLDEIQSAINLSAVAVFSAMKKMWQWKQQELQEKDRASFFDLMGQDIQIIKVVLLLTGAMFGTRNIVHEYLKSFGKYNWLWKEEPEVSYKNFMRTNPTLADFEAELQRFMTLEKEINSIVGERVIGSLKLHTANIKKTLIDETRQWKQSYSAKVRTMMRITPSVYTIHVYQPPPPTYTKDVY